jgi:hypothetical protein
MEDPRAVEHLAPPAPDAFGDTLATIFGGYWKLFGALLIVGIGSGLLVAVTDVLQLEGLARMEEGRAPGTTFVLANVVLLVGAAYFWTVSLLRADNRYRYGRVGGEFTQAFSFLLPVTLYLLLYILAMTIGMILLFVPGIFLAILLLPGVTLIILRDAGVLDALRRSASLVWGSWWFTLGVLLVLMLTAVAVFLLLVVPLAMIDVMTAGSLQSLDADDRTLAVAFSVGAVVLMYPLTTSASYTLLHALETRKRNAAMERELLSR